MVIMILDSFILRAGTHMQITVFGAGYVGLTMATCLAETGNKVICFDTNSDKIKQLQKGLVPIYEKSLTELVKKNLVSKHLHFTSNPTNILNNTEVAFIAVGTPFHSDHNSPDLSQVNAVADLIGTHLNFNCLVIIKSTVPVGTSHQIKKRIQNHLNNRKQSQAVHVVFNPEFLKEGTAVQNCLKPDRIFFGMDSSEPELLLRQLYAPFNRNNNRILIMDVLSAELTKYAANSMLATKISLMNEFSQIADQVNANIECVRQGIGSDPRIGFDFIYAGCGYGGSCFPKDIKALIYTGKQYNVDCRLLEAVHTVNENQKKRLFHHIMNYFNRDISGKTFAVWGAAFKPETDDLREAPSLTLLNQLWSAGATTKVFDPKSAIALKNIFPNQENLTICENMYQATQQASALIICTDWQEFKSPDFDLIHQSLIVPLIFDGRNLYDPKLLKKKQITYIGMGIRN